MRTPRTGDAPVATEAPIILDEVSSLAIPDSYPPFQIRADHGGKVALISNRWGHLLVERDGIFEEVGVGTLHRPIGLTFDSSGALEVFDAGSSSIYRFERGWPVSKRHLDVDLTLTSAVRTPGREWWVAGLDSTGTVQVGPVGGEGGWRELNHLVRGEAAALTVVNRGVIVTQARHPFSWTMIPADGEPVRIEIEPIAIPEERQQAVDPLWVSSALVQVQEYLFYTITDLRSDHRFVLLLTDDGELIRRTPLNAPLAFLEYAPSSAVLTAVRDINGRELVSYRIRQNHIQGSASEVHSP